MKIFELSKNPPECRVDGSIFALASPTPTLFDQVADQLAKELTPSLHKFPGSKGRKPCK